MVPNPAGTWIGPGGVRGGSVAGSAQAGAGAGAGTEARVELHRKMVQMHNVVSFMAFHACVCAGCDVG